MGVNGGSPRLTDAEAAQALGLESASPLPSTEFADFVRQRDQTVRRWRMEGRGPVFVRMGNRAYYRPSDILEWLESQRMEHSAKAAES